MPTTDCMPITDCTPITDCIPNTDYMPTTDGMPIIAGMSTADYTILTTDCKPYATAIDCMTGIACH